MTPAILEILINREVIAIDQDPAGKQGRRLSQTGDREVWMRELTGGAKAVALFNRGAETVKMSVQWSDVGMTGKPQVRDLWLHRDVEVGDGFAGMVPSHGVVLLRVAKPRA